MAENIQDKAENSDDEPTPGTDPTPDNEGGNDDLQSKFEHWKAESRKWEKRSKENADKAKLWDEYQASQKTEEQKRADELAAAADARQLAERDAKRARAALRYGLDESQLDLLDASGTEEEFEARAKALSELLSANQTPQRRRDPNLGREKTNPSSGGDWLRQRLTGS